MREGNTERLLELFADSLRRGHWRVACRRYFMLQACGAQVPEEQRGQCARLLSRCSTADLDKMERDARAWALLVEAGDVVLPAAPARGREPAQRSQPRQPLSPWRPLLERTQAALQPSGIRTQWRPLPACFAAPKALGT